MTQIMLDAGMQSKLNNLKESLELCDESGKVLAHLFPVVDPSQYERFEPVITPEELQRRRLEPDCSTAEVLARLQMAFPSIDRALWQRYVTYFQQCGFLPAPA